MSTTVGDFLVIEVKADPNEGNVIVDIAKQVLGAVLPGHKDK